MFAGVFVYSFLIGSISAIFFSLDSSKQEERKRRETLSRIHAKYTLNPKLYKRVRNAITFSGIINEDIQGFMQDLPKKYQNLLVNEMYREPLAKIELFAGKTKEFIAFIGPKLTKHKIDKDDFLYYKGEMADESKHLSIANL